MRMAALAHAWLPEAALWVLPSWRHPGGKRPVASFAHRLAMCRLAMVPVPAAEVSDYERRLDGDGRTLSLVQALRRDAPLRPLRLLLGGDQYAQRHTWHRFSELAELAPPLVVGREGSEAVPQAVGLPGAPTLPNLSSSAIRAAFTTGAGGMDGCAAAVRRYVAEHGLYGARRR